MMDQKSRVCKILCLIFAVILLTAGCGREKADDLTELELGHTEEQAEDTVKETAEDEMAESGEKDETVFVYVCGAVNAPGVYELASDARVYEAITLAGGVRDDAASEALNQARLVTDGERIYIPTLEELEKGIVDGIEPEVTGTDSKNEGKININTASKEELKTLPGIGDAKADSIISYRESNGGFQSIEDLMNVEGIKEGVFNKIKDNIVTA